ncbi:MAG: hypothetical protein R3247_01515 [Rhodothermales bacterium]|nr:hypothetical protein [Rhodothermales bacterium]
MALHLVLGWAWTLGAGIAAGLWAGPRGWLLGGAGVGMAWGALVLYNYAVAAEPVGQMASTMGGILGGMPGAATLGLTLLVGILLGAAGGGVGTQLRRLARPR